MKNPFCISLLSAIIHPVNGTCEEHNIEIQFGEDVYNVSIFLSEGELGIMSQCKIRTRQNVWYTCSTRPVQWRQLSHKQGCWWHVVSFSQRSVLSSFI